LVLKARDLMTRDVFTLPASLSLGEAAWALMHRGVTGAPVRDAAGRLVGMVSNADLVDPERGAGGGEPQTIEDVMTPALIAVEEDDPAIEAVHLMVAHGVHRVVVLKRSGELLGIITPMDFLRRLLLEGGLESSDDARATLEESPGRHPHH
jgi:predicted transcriptional regulator